MDGDVHRRVTKQKHGAAMPPHDRPHRRAVNLFFLRSMIMAKTMKYKGKYGTLEIEQDGSLGFAPEVYCTELNLGKKLTEGNVSALLRWKDTRLSPCSEKAKRVLARLDEINAFRAGKQAELASFFGGGGVYNVFIKHIARPAEYPIYDSHVLNAYWRLEKGLADGESVRVTQKAYEEYRAFFFKVYEAVFGTDERKNDLETVKKMKALDAALIAYNKAHEK